MSWIRRRGSFCRQRHEPLHFRRKRWRQRRPVRFAVENSRDRVRDRLARERASPGQHFIEHAAERPDIGSLVDRLAARLLGAHVRAGAEDHAVVRRIGIRDPLRVALVDRRWRRLRQTEIQQLQLRPM